MRKFFALTILTLFSFNISTAMDARAKNGAKTEKSTKRAATKSSGKKDSKKNERRLGNHIQPVSQVSKVVAEKTNSTTPVNSFADCMDSFCKSKIADDERGRCRCSSQLGRIEKALRDIDKIRDEADAKNKSLEALMNVSDTASMDDSLSQVYKNINTVEKKARKVASSKIDANTRVVEGLPLYNEALKRCDSVLSSAPAGDREGLKSDYMTLIEEDCSAYTSVIKDKADAASQLLVQAQKNQEMYEDQEYKKLNQLDTNACYQEYETCLKEACGEDFTSCLENVKLEASIKKCESINYGKCEENKSVVLMDLRKAVKQGRAKERVRQSCLSDMGQIRDGKCLFEVRFTADRCTSGDGCGSADTKYFNPGYRVRCDDTNGDFRDVKWGCDETCYLVDAKGSTKNIGRNGRGAFCSGFDTYTLPVPAGWGTDGYPLEEELKKAF